MALTLTSPKNPRVKALMALAKGKERAETGLFSVEGAREIARALDAGYVVAESFAAPDLLSDEARAVLRRTEKSCAPHIVSADVFAKIAMRDDKDGIVFVFKARSHRLGDLHNGGAAPLVIAVESVEKPGNLGALLRSADGAGATAVVAIGSGGDFYHQHVIRNSLGTVFAMPTATASLDEVVAHARANRWTIFAAALSDRAIDCFAADFSKPCIILLGTEATGLSPAAIAAADQVIKIPMAGIADSLNVSAAGAVLMYEASRQRRGHLPTSRK
jgi:TrmH family RNA methyltransferase